MASNAAIAKGHNWISSPLNCGFSRPLFVAEEIGQGNT
jgi:hypothetical protein